MNEKMMLPGDICYDVPEIEIVVVVAPGQRLRVHWQQSNFRPTITEELTLPEAGLKLNVASCALSGVTRKFVSATFEQGDNRQ